MAQGKKLHILVIKGRSGGNYLWHIKLYLTQDMEMIFCGKKVYRTGDCYNLYKRAKWREPI